MATLSDLSLVTQVAVFRNTRAFDQLVRKYQSPVRRFLLSLTLGNEALSDDLAQDTFLKAYQNIGKFQGLAAFQTWLMRIAYNVFCDYKRSRAAKAAARQTDDTGDGQPYTVDYELKTDIYRALSLLKDEERTCITLQLIDGESIDHIAEITSLPPNTVKSHLRRGKERLATYLKQNGYDRP